MDNRDIRCCGHVADLGRRLSAHGSRGNGRKGGSGPPGRAEEGSIEGKGGEGRKSAATFLLPGRLHPIRDPDTRGSLSTLPCVATLAEWPSYVCVQYKSACRASAGRPGGGEEKSEKATTERGRDGGGKGNGNLHERALPIRHPSSPYPTDEVTSPGRLAKDKH